MTVKQVAELEERHRALRDKWQADRVQAVLALSRGWPVVHIAEILLIDEKTSRHYFQRYVQGGAEALLADLYLGAAAKLTQAQRSELRAYLQETISTDAKPVNASILKQYRVGYTLSGATGLLHRLDFSYKKPTHVPGKQDPARQICILVDNARYYHSNQVREALESSKIKRLFLPPYSPNLNVIERFWQFFKKKVLNNHDNGTGAEFKQACDGFFRKRKKYLAELKTLLTGYFHIQYT